MLARFERLPAADFRYRIFVWRRGAASRADLFQAAAALPGSLCAVLARTAFGTPRRLTLRANRRKEGWENYERHSPSQKSGRGQLI
jgi:hypothetical protein